MATSVTAVGIEFEGADWGDLDGVVIDEIVRGGPDEPSEVRGRDDIALGRIGRVRRNRRRDVRMIEMRGWVLGTDISDHWTNRIALGAAMDARNDGTLNATYRNGQTYTIEARPVSVVYSLESQSSSRVSLVFESVAPDWELGS